MRVQRSTFLCTVLFCSTLANSGCVDTPTPSAWADGIWETTLRQHADDGPDEVWTVNDNGRVTFEQTREACRCEVPYRLNERTRAFDDTAIRVDTDVDGVPTSTTTFTFDDEGRVSRFVNDLFAYDQRYDVTYAYDDQGRLESFTDIDDVTTTAEYDGGDRVVRILRNLLPTWTATYDDDGRITSSDDGRTHNAYRYDDDGRLAESDNTFQGETYVTSYTYDEQGRFVLAESATAAGEAATSRGAVYDDDGHLTETFHHDHRTDAGYSTTRRYDDAGRLVAFDTQTAAGAFEYTDVDENTVEVAFFLDDEWQSTTTYARRDQPSASVPPLPVFDIPAPHPRAEETMTFPVWE